MSPSAKHISTQGYSILVYCILLLHPPIYRLSSPLWGQITQDLVGKELFEELDDRREPVLCP